MDGGPLSVYANTMPPETLVVCIFWNLAVPGVCGYLSRCILSDLVKTHFIHYPLGSIPQSLTSWNFPGIRGLLTDGLEIEGISRELYVKRVRAVGKSTHLCACLQPCSGFMHPRYITVLLARKSRLALDSASTNPCGASTSGGS